MNRRTLLIVLLVAALPVLWFFVSTTPFDSETWKKHDSSQSDAYPRLSMADDLIQKNTLQGLKKEKVLELLGDPGDHGYFQQYELVYWLGPERSFISIDSEWLAISINKDSGIVESYKLVRD